MNIISVLCETNTEITAWKDNVWLVSFYNNKPLYHLENSLYDKPLLQKASRIWTRFHNRGTKVIKSIYDIKIVTQ